jgi:hypothetical protein
LISLSAAMRTLVREDTAFGERTEHGAHTAARHPAPRARPPAAAPSAGASSALRSRIEHARRLEPEHEAIEIVQRIRPAHSRVGVHEVEPQTLRHERELRTLASITVGV